LEYSLNQLQSSLKDSFEAFKSAQFLCPYKVNMLNLKAADLDSLSCFQFLRNNLPELNKELAEYLAKTVDVDETIDVLQ
jgi:hypothetical protein